MSNASVISFKRFLAGTTARLKGGIPAVLASCAEDLVADMKRRCPVEADTPFRRRPGLLRDSISWVFGNAPRTRATGAIRLGGRGSRGLRVTIFAGNDDAFYARFVEFGTRAGTKGERIAVGTKKSRKRTRKVKRTHPGNPAQPFFWPAYRAQRNAIRRKLGLGVKQEVEKAA